MEKLADPLSPLATATGLRSILYDLKYSPSPHVPNPPSCKKRASVALIIRIRPAAREKSYYDPLGCSSATHHFDDCISNFFKQEWVQHGDPEVLFIKRAARAGDRWTSHVALPGGRRDSGDADDMAASVRETWEETGLELDKDYCLKIGNLPERVITTSWGKQPLMVLCPFVYLMLRYDTPPLDLQPSEVQSAHWVSLRSLLYPNLRTFERTDISDRAVHQRSLVVKSVLRFLAGQMMFSAVKLQPSESLIYRAAPKSASLGFESRTFKHSLFKTVSSWFNGERSQGTQSPLLLWGLTLGITADFLENLDSAATANLWSWPTFSHWDIQFWVWALTRSFRRRSLQELRASKQPSASRTPSERVGGVDTTTYTTSTVSHAKGPASGIAGAHLLDGYFAQMKRAVLLAFGVRLSAGVLLLVYLLGKIRQRRAKLKEIHSPLKR